MLPLLNIMQGRLLKLACITFDVILLNRPDGEGFSEFFLRTFSKSNPRDLWPNTWHLRHWLHFWQLRTTILTFTLWPLNKEWWWQHSQFLRCFGNTPKVCQTTVFTGLPINLKTSSMFFQPLWPLPDKIAIASKRNYSPFIRPWHCEEPHFHFLSFLSLKIVKKIFLQFFFIRPS